MNSIEKKAAISLASVFGLRMLGLFMILPVFAIYGTQLPGYSPIWLGLAIGAGVLLLGLRMGLVKVLALAALAGLALSAVGSA